MSTNSAGRIVLLLLASVAMGVGQTNPTLTTSAATLNFTYTLGATALPAAQTLNVRSTPNGVGFTLAVTGPAPYNAAWLLVSANQGRAPQAVGVQVNPTGLPAGTHQATITITATSGSPAPVATVTVTLVVGTPAPTITVNPSSLSFTYVTGQPVAGNLALQRNFVLSNTGSAIPAAVSVAGANWIRIAPTGNVTLVGLLNSITVTVDPTGLAPRVYSGTIKIESKQAANPSLTLAVTLTVQAAPPVIRSTWPLGVIQQSPNSTVTLVGQNFFSNTTVAMAGLTAETTITVSDGTFTASETFHLPVYPNSSPVLRVAMGSPFRGGAVGVAYPTLALQSAGGSPPYSYTLTSGALPPGLTLSSGNISGTPVTAGTYYFTLQVEDSTLPFSARAYLPVKMVILPSFSGPQPRILGPSTIVPAATAGTALPVGTAAQAVGGGGTYSWTATGLPPGLAINATTGAITGTPTSSGLSGPLTATLVSEGAMLVTIPAANLTNPGILRLTATTPAPGGGISNEAQFYIYGPQPQVTAVLNAASFRQGIVSPGEILTIYGLGLGPATLTLFDPSVPAPQISAALPLTGAQTTVTINGTPAPILYTSTNQVSVIVPYGVTGPNADVVVSFGGVASQPFTVSWAATNPGVFTVDASGRGQAAVLNFNATTGDYTLNGGTNAANRGQTVVLYLTGMGATNLPVENTLIPASPPVGPIASPSVTIGGQAAAVTGVVSPIGSVPGLLQLNVTVPANAPTGAAVPVVVNLGGVDSQAAVTMAVR